jgi:hypothetical protein
MHLRQPTHTFLIVGAADARPLAVYRGLPLQTNRIITAPAGYTLVYDAGKLAADQHKALADGLAVLRGLPYETPEAPEVLLVGGEPALVLDQNGKEVHTGIGGRLFDLIRDHL